MEAQLLASCCTALLLLLFLNVNGDTARFSDAGLKIKDSDIANTIPGQVDQPVKTCHFCHKVGKYCYQEISEFALPGNLVTDVVIKKMGIINDILFYSHLTSSDDLDPDIIKIRYVSIKHPYLSGVFRINQPISFSSFDINQKTNQIFLGSSNGIWVIENFDINNYKLTRYSDDEDKTITNINSIDYLYYTTDDYAGIVQDNNGKLNFILQGNSINNFVVVRDKDPEYNVNVVYLNGTGLYAFSNKTYTEVKLHKSRFFRGLTVDKEGVVFAWDLFGIYQVFFNEVFSNSNLTQVSEFVVGEGAMTFDKSNNIYYNKLNLLFKLTKTSKTDC